eukprot:6198087-Pleurochrysis_carterae.AAC.2
MRPSARASICLRALMLTRTLDPVLHLSVDAGAGGADEGVEVQHDILVSTAATVEASSVLGPPLHLLEQLLVLLLQLLARHPERGETWCTCEYFACTYERRLEAVL